LKNWAAISEKVLDPPSEDDVREKEKEKEKDEAKKLDPRLLSPIDLRRNPPSEGSPYNKIREKSNAEHTKTTSNSTPPPPPKAVETRAPSPTSSDLASVISTDSAKTACSDTAQSGTPAPSMPTSASISGSGSGIFARAFSSMNIAGEARNDGEVGSKPPKRSASFTSLSSLVRKGGALMGSGKSEFTHTSGLIVGMDDDRSKRSSGRESE
jgi:hypothetical protein